MSELRFDGRVAVVTGAGAGLGKEYALLLALRGCKIVVNDLGGSHAGEGSSQKAADVVVQQIRSNGGVAVPDYNSVTDGEKIIKTAIDNFGRIDIVINNAGILRDRSFLKLSELDWDLIFNVHVKGSFKTTQAAWPYFKKQNYGRVVMTSSNSGVYGNFGQANYSSAKLALIGLANTLAIEGSKNNIHCNVIVPTAASRLTEGILPDLLFEQLKPKLIAPVVAYLCHESNDDNGSIIESAAGWATKIHFVRGEGTVLRTSLEDDVTIENVKSSWSKITDMSKSKHVSAIAGASGSLLNVLEELQSGDSKLFPYQSEFKFDFKDLILYSLGIGASKLNENDLKYLYENHSDFTPMPTFFVMPGLLLSMTTGMVTSAITHTEVNLTNILHGEQYLEILSDLPLNGELTTKGRIIDVMDKQSGAIVVTECETFDEYGNLLAKNQSSVFIIGAGNFGGKREPSEKVVSSIPNPKAAPTATIHYKTNENQAALYRLSGDLNPMHIDPGFSTIAGYKTPILHGLCTLGFSVRAVLEKYANSDPKLFKAVKVRFSKPVTPGDTLSIDMWQVGNRVYFRTVVVEKNQESISGAYVDLKNVVISKSRL